MKHKNKTAVSAKKFFANVLHIQKSSLGAGFSASICENEEIAVDGFSDIIEYSSSVIRLGAELFIMEIHGKNLEICSISSESVNIKGKIFEVKYDMYN